MKKTKFEKGQIVVHKSIPEMTGVVISVIPEKPENLYNVFMNNETKTFYESQLKAKAVEDNDQQHLDINNFHAHLTALQINYPGLSHLYSLNAARIEFIPYQFRPVLKFIRSDRPRLLIADSVGVGKTFEAGLILKELQARKDIESVLIICPHPLVVEKKWETEMKRFEENFRSLKTDDLWYCIDETDMDGEWPQKYQRAIIPYSLLKNDILYASESNRYRKKGLLDLETPPHFDLVIVDEAHHIRNQNTARHIGVKYFCDNAESVLFLSGTPVQLENHDLFVLLHLLRPDLVIDEESFAYLFEPNPFINQAVNFARAKSENWMHDCIDALDKAANTSWGMKFFRNHPTFKKLQFILSNGNVQNESRVKIISDIESLHTFSGIINRTLRSDIGDFTIRKPQTVTVNFTSTQKAFYADLMNIQKQIVSMLHGEKHVNFLLTTIKRQASSCVFGLIPFLEEILNRRSDKLNSLGDYQIELLSEKIEGVRHQIQIIVEKAKQFSQDDPKFDELYKIIQDKQRIENNKLMVFSSFIHTLKYLYQRLKNNDIRVGLMYGKTPEKDRVHIRQRFKLPSQESESLDVLLISEIGCEGLDYQFCDCIVNYDIPWNPMKIEQRIGRIDRKGQKSETIAIINFITPGTIDSDIYFRCLLRIGIFNRALGGNDAILGEIIEEIENIANNYSLTEKERQDKLQQLSDNRIREIQEQNVLEKKQHEFLGLRLPKDQIKQEIEAASSFWLSPLAIQRIVSLYLKQINGNEKEYILGEKSIKTLRLSKNLRSKLLDDFRKLPLQIQIKNNKWKNWLKGNLQHLQISFESEAASEHQNAELITPLHPLVKQACLDCDTSLIIKTQLCVKTDLVPQGLYHFVIFQWHYKGMQEDMTFKAITNSGQLTENLFPLLKKAETDLNRTDESYNNKKWQELNDLHYHFWKKECNNYQEHNKKLIEYKKESLAKSHCARINLLEERLCKVDNEKIQKMHIRQLEKANTDYMQRIQEMDIALQQADIIWKPVAQGTFLVEKI